MKIKKFSVLVTLVSVGLFTFQGFTKAATNLQNRISTDIPNTINNHDLSFFIQIRPNCKAKEHLSERLDSFAARCVKAQSVRQIPTEILDINPKLQYIFDNKTKTGYKTAWKIISRKEYLKP